VRVRGFLLACPLPLASRRPSQRDSTPLFCLTFLHSASPPLSTSSKISFFFSIFSFFFFVVVLAAKARELDEIFWAAQHRRFLMSFPSSQFFFWWSIEAAQFQGLPLSSSPKGSWPSSVVHPLHPLNWSRPASWPRSRQELFFGILRPWRPRPCFSVFFGAPLFFSPSSSSAGSAWLWRCFVLLPMILAFPSLMIFLTDSPHRRVLPFAATSFPSHPGRLQLGDPSSPGARSPFALLTNIDMFRDSF